MVIVQKNKTLRIRKTKRVLASNLEKKEPMTTFKFVMSVLWGTVAALTVILIFTVYATIIFFGSLRWVDASDASYPGNLTLEKVIYSNDKISYRLDEIINLNIINNTDRSIFLAPCEYFNKFEKKISGVWQAVILDSCDKADAASADDFQDKISKKITGAFEAKKLGEGTWRGVSTVYFGCQKPLVENCEYMKTVYTRMFTISDSANNPAGYPNSKL